MIREVIEEALRITGGEDGWASLRSSLKEGEKSRKAFLADKLIGLTRAGGISWVVSDEKDVVVGEAEWFRFVIYKTRGGSDGYGNPSFLYTLVVFDGQKEVLRERARQGDWQGPYNSSSRRLPVMDLYDIVIEGKLRRVPPAHVCGAQGFGMGYGDVCPACEERKR